MSIEKNNQSSQNQSLPSTDDTNNATSNGDGTTDGSSGPAPSAPVSNPITTSGKSAAASSKTNVTGSDLDGQTSF